MTSTKTVKIEIENDQVINIEAKKGVSVKIIDYDGNTHTYNNRPCTITEMNFTEGEYNQPKNRQPINFQIVENIG